MGLSKSSKQPLELPLHLHGLSDLKLNRTWWQTWKIFRPWLVIIIVFCPPPACYFGLLLPYDHKANAHSIQSSLHWADTGDVFSLIHRPSCLHANFHVRLIFYHSKSRKVCQSGDVMVVLYGHHLNIRGRCLNFLDTQLTAHALLAW